MNQFLILGFNRLNRRKILSAFRVKLRVDIFDHFGLDVGDIEKFGSMENVRDKTAPLGKILSHLTHLKEKLGNELSDTGVSDIFFQEAAEGFCSWFILQYIRGYKLFVTMMSKEIEKTLEE